MRGGLESGELSNTSVISLRWDASGVCQVGLGETAGLGWSQSERGGRELLQLMNREPLVSLSCGERLYPLII